LDVALIANGHGGRREDAGSGGKRQGAGRPKGAPDAILAPAHVVPTAQKWEFAEYALQHAKSAIDTLAHLMDHAESETARIMAADKILDRSLGKAPQHIDITALRHTDIVYQSERELRAEIRKALEEEGVPGALMDLTVEPVEPEDGETNG